MAAPDLPMTVKTYLASTDIRAYHHYWHLVRNQEFWENALTKDERLEFTQQGWQAPRFDYQVESGLDFLYMHRQMITVIDQMLSHIGDAVWTKVEGWNPIPWSDTDPLWPVPIGIDPTGADLEPETRDARSQAQITRMQQLVTNLFENDNWLRQQTLDQLGYYLEWTIHGWMHLRWSGPRPNNPNSADPTNDWLFRPWSSHVNKYFWKLHGWIDERITAWENATGRKADFSAAWSGPSIPQPLTRQSNILPIFSFRSGHGMEQHAHSADIALMRVLPSLNNTPLTVAPRKNVVESIIQSG